jgi:hypothetical protein
MNTHTVFHRHRSLPTLAVVGAFALFGGVSAFADGEGSRSQPEHAKPQHVEQRSQREHAPPQQIRVAEGNRGAAAPRGNQGGNRGAVAPQGNQGGNRGAAAPRPQADGGRGARPPNRATPPPTNFNRPSPNNLRPSRPAPPIVNRPGYRPPPTPRYAPRLPPGYARHYWNNSPYYFAGGYWYRPWGASFQIVAAPFGLFVPSLPSYYSAFWYGGSRYFFAGSTYYLYDATRRGYVVTRSPYGDEELQQGSVADEQVFVYPAQGQSEQQTADDRYDCHRWAVDQTGYDPVEANYDAARREEYQRASTACLTGRGYTVR